MSARLLLLEDELNVGSTLQERLQLDGYEVTWVKSISAARSALKESEPVHHPFDLAILDVNLPDGSGFDVGKLIRNQSPSTAVIFLTAAGNPEDRVHGLELGAEDYIVKPFHFKEFLLRLQNALKRVQFVSQSLPHAIQIGKAEVHFSQYELMSPDESGVTQTHHLSHKECALLKLLHEKQGNVVSRDDILNLVWSEDEYPTPRTIDNFILRLRKLIEPNPAHPTVIRSIRGVGYLLEKTES